MLPTVLLKEGQAPDLDCPSALEGAGAPGAGSVPTQHRCSGAPEPGSCDGVPRETLPKQQARRNTSAASYSRQFTSDSPG